MTTPDPGVSIIIPAYHSHSTLGLCLDALRQQTHDDFETIVVNSSSEDETRRLVEERYPEVIFEQSDRRLLPHAARNRGVELARGRDLVFSDPDCVPRPDWLETLLKAGAEDRVVQGSMGLHGSGWRASGIHLCKWHALLPGLPARSLWLVATGNALYPRPVWERVGPFDGDLWCGDAVLSWRAAAAGVELVFEPRAVVDQIHDQSLRTLCRERIVRGREFGGARSTLEGWSRSRCLLSFVSTPLLAILISARTALASLRAGWSGRFLRTLPIHTAGSLAWLLGEASALLRRAAGKGAVDISAGESA